MKYFEIGVLPSFSLLPLKQPTQTNHAPGGTCRCRILIEFPRSNQAFRGVLNGTESFHVRCHRENIDERWKKTGSSSLDIHAFSNALHANFRTGFMSCPLNAPGLFTPSGHASTATPHSLFRCVFFLAQTYRLLLFEQRRQEICNHKQQDALRGPLCYKIWRRKETKLYKSLFVYFSQVVHLLDITFCTQCFCAVSLNVDI